MAARRVSCLINFISPTLTFLSRTRAHLVSKLNPRGGSATNLVKALQQAHDAALDLLLGQAATSAVHSHGGEGLKTGHDDAGRGSGQERRSLHGSGGGADGRGGGAENGGAEHGGRNWLAGPVNEEMLGESTARAWRMRDGET